MNLADLTAAFAKNKTGFAVAGAAGVAGLGLIASSRKKSDAAAAAKVSTYSSTPLAATGAAGAYDSSSSDVYNAIQPQLEGLGRYMAELEELWKQQNTPTPVPGPPPATPVSIQPVPTPAQPAYVPPYVGAPVDPNMTSTSGRWIPTTRNGVPDGGSIPAGGWTAPTGKAAVGSGLYNSAGRLLGKITGYTFNGVAQHSYEPGISMDDAYNATKNPIYR